MLALTREEPRVEGLSEYGSIIALPQEPSAPSVSISVYLYVNLTSGLTGEQLDASHTQHAIVSLDLDCIIRTESVSGVTLHHGVHSHSPKIPIVGELPVKFKQRRHVACIMHTNQADLIQLLHRTLYKLCFLRLVWLRPLF